MSWAQGGSAHQQSQDVLATSSVINIDRPKINWCIYICLSETYPNCSRAPSPHPDPPRPRAAPHLRGSAQTRASDGSRV